MSILRYIKPIFWKHTDVGEGPFKHLFNFRKIWKLAVVLSAAIALLPVVSTGIFDYRVTKDAMEAETHLRTARLVSNSRRTVSFFLAERKAALDLIVHHHDLKELNDETFLTRLLDTLQNSFGGFTDLGVIDTHGKQQTYVGPYELKGADYSKENWFQEVSQAGAYVSDVFMGFRNVPHLVIAVKHHLSNAGFFVLRASVDTERFNSLLSQLEVSPGGDAFIINRIGIVQTPPRHCGALLEKCSLPVPEFSERTQVFETYDKQNQHLVIGYAYIQDTPFILMIVKQKNELMRPWYETRVKLVGFLAASITTILLVILAVATHLVNKIYLADEKRLMVVHQAEYANKMASIGRLAAGVAHEINNPLEIINQKAGLIKDLFTHKKPYAGDRKLMDLVDWIIRSVERCGAITRRLLNFARHVDMNIEEVSIGEVIDEVIGLLGKEAEYRNIEVEVKVDDQIPKFQTDRGKLQQIFLNLVNNALAAIDRNGRLYISVHTHDRSSVQIQVADSGCGISKADLDRIFEPFFSTRKKEGGTGLGLSITYGLVKELSGEIHVQSEVSQGTTFTITLPLTITKERSSNEGLIC
jgi:two-component system NtrC family sensor kinase